MDDYSVRESKMKNYKIFIVEDDKSLLSALENYINNWGMQSIAVKDFHNVTKEVGNSNPHLILMDIKLPYMDGYCWCKEIRQISSVPIIFMSSASDQMNIIMAINMGADDFVCKPFETSLLIAKIQALLRREYEFGQVSQLLECEGVILNVSDHSLQYEGKKMDLTKNEYCILYAMMRNKGVVLSREKLMQILWESESFVDENTLTVNIGRLRKKLASAEYPDFIQTKFGEGYYIRTTS